MPTPDEILEIIQALNPGRRIVWLKAHVDKNNTSKYVEKDE